MYLLDTHKLIFILTLDMSRVSLIVQSIEYREIFFVNKYSDY